MDTTFDHLVTNNAQSGHIATRSLIFNPEKIENISTNESILDLSQRSSSSTTEITNSNKQSVVIENWSNDFTCVYTDDINNDLNQLLILNSDQQLNIEQSLTDQLTNDRNKENSLSDNSNQSQMDLYSSKKKIK
jgi:hypothetical protein